MKLIHLIYQNCSFIGERGNNSFRFLTRSHSICSVQKYLKGNVHYSLSLKLKGISSWTHSNSQLVEVEHVVISGEIPTVDYSGKRQI